MNYDRFSLAYPPRHINNAVKTVRHNGPDGEYAIITTENLFRGHLTNQTNLIRSAVNVVRTAFRRINVWSFRYLHFFFYRGGARACTNPSGDYGAHCFINPPEVFYGAAAIL